MQLPQPAPLATSVAIIIHIRTNVFTGVYFQLNGVNYGNNSIVNIANIGEGERGSLICMTTNTDCCDGSTKKGEWYYPNNMSTVRAEGEGGSFFRNRGPRVVRLHRRHDVMMPTGQFCCEVPDANETIQRICIIVVPSEGMYG